MFWLLILHYSRFQASLNIKIVRCKQLVSLTEVCAKLQDLSLSLLNIHSDQVQEGCHETEQIDQDTNHRYVDSCLNSSIWGIQDYLHSNNYSG